LIPPFKQLFLVERPGHSLAIQLLDVGTPLAGAPLFDPVNRNSQVRRTRMARQTTKNSNLKMPKDADTELMTNIRKALSADENAPKQKHVRACILYTWDYKNGMVFWSGMKQQPILGDEVTTWKALVLFHKVVRGGHPNVRLFAKCIANSHGRHG